jgi:hypothetical protein
LAAGNFRNALAAPRIFHNHYGDLLVLIEVGARCAASTMLSSISSGMGSDVSKARTAKRQETQKNRNLLGDWPVDYGACGAARTDATWPGPRGVIYSVY